MGVSCSMTRKGPPRPPRATPGRRARGLGEHIAARAAAVVPCILWSVLAACGRPAAPDVVLVTFDTTRYDHLGCSGDPEASTPAVDALARRGLLFERAFADTALTLPSHTTIMTGLDTPAHGVRDNGRFHVPDGAVTLAQRLREAGWDTAAFVSAFVLDSRYGLDRGFDVYDDDTRSSQSPLDFTVPSRPGREVTDAALGWLAGRQPERPFFLWVHYYDPASAARRRAAVRCHRRSVRGRDRHGRRRAGTPARRRRRRAAGP